MSKTSSKQPSKVNRSHNTAGEIKRKSGLTLGLGVFEKISAVEGIRLTEKMRRDVRAATGKGMSESEGTRYLTDRYGKK